MLGMGHWLVLRRAQVPGAGWGALGGGLGLAAGFLMGWVLGAFPFDFLGGLLLMGFGLGVSQWLALRGRVARAGLWMPVSALGFGFGGAVGLACVVPIAGAIEAAMGGGALGFAAIVGTIGATAGLVASLITGAVLVRLPR